MAMNPALAQVPDKLQQAIAFHQEGRLAEARAAYEEILQIQPKHFDALHLLGVIAAQTNDPQRAVELIRESIASDPSNAAAYAAHTNVGSALRTLNQLGAALASYNRAVALGADVADAYFNRGTVLHELKQLDAALASYDQAIALDAD